jgi:hypothetical protein
MLKRHRLYIIYEHYIKSKNISNGAKKLMMISENSFNNFKSEYEKNKQFKIKIDDLIKSEIRDNKINDLLENDDFFK